MLLPARVKEVYLAHMLQGLGERGVRSAIVFTATCRGCHLLSLLLQVGLGFSESRGLEGLRNCKSVRCTRSDS